MTFGKFVCLANHVHYMSGREVRRFGGGYCLSSLARLIFFSEPLEFCVTEEVKYRTKFGMGYFINELSRLAFPCFGYPYFSRNILYM